MAETVVLDTNVFLNVINREEPMFASSSRLLDLVDEGRVRAVVSTVTLAELSTGYYVVGDEKGWKALLLHMLSSEHYSVVDVDVNVTDRAGRVRAETGLRMPDSIIVASGLVNNAGYVVTHDEEFNKASSRIQSITSEEFVEQLIK
ncbi:PIN domain-containing protein [Candidatus Bathyarchaeota archaeon]|nr:PIN domain-containing protein [Candidatus Bathyarchaeota archaeon]